MATESEIEQSIRRLSDRLHEFDQLAADTGVTKNQRAAAAAAALSRELEQLQQQVEALGSGQRQSAQPGSEAGNRPGRSGSDQMADLSAAREGLARSRRYAEGLLAPWAQGESWAVDARSIQRQLSRAQIEDFINQPALWQTLLDPVRELASALQAQTEMERLSDHAFSPAEQTPASPYEPQVET